jgi:Double zinc ribbon
VNCPKCRRANAAQRKFCGGCGVSLAEACRQCGFENDASDAYCGGCGQGLAVAPGPTPAARVAAPSPRTIDELAGLFAAPAVAPDAPPLPSANIGQDDLDRLFGGSS